MPSAKKLEDRAISIVHMLRKATRTMTKPAATQIIEKFGRDPYITLIGCILSQQTRDSISLPASLELFKVAKTPEKMVKVPIKDIEKRDWDLDIKNPTKVEEEVGHSSGELIKILSESLETSKQILESIKKEI